MKNKNNGFSLVELIVTMALMAIITVVTISSFTTLTEESRQKADIEKLDRIGAIAQELFTYKEVFDEFVKNANSDGEVKIKLPISMMNKKGIVYLADIKIGDTYKDLAIGAPKFREYLTEAISFPLNLNSNRYIDGYYLITIKLNKAQLSDVRDVSYSKDDVQISGKYVED